MDSKYSDTEIDLVQLLARGIVILRKNIVIITVCLILGAGSGFYFYKTYSRFYESKMILSSNILTEYYANQIASGLTALTGSDKYDVVDKELSLSREDLAKLNSLTIINVTDEDKNLSSTRIYLKIQAQVTDNSVLPKLEAGIIQFIKNSSYVKERVEQKRKYFTELIAKITNELDKLETMKEKIMAGSQHNNDQILIDPSSIFTTSVDLYEERLSYIQSLETLTGVELVHGFTAVSYSAPRLILFISGGLFFGFVLGVSVLFLRFLINYKLPEQK